MDKIYLENTTSSLPSTPLTAPTHSVLSHQSFPPRLGPQIQIRRFPNATHAVTRARLRIVIRGTVPGRAVVPNSHVVPVPLEADLSVVVLSHELSIVIPRSVCIY